MKEWLTEAIDQIALGEFLANSSVSCGQRFGLIAVDNAIEFMLVAYVEIDKQLVGGHKLGGVAKKEWDETKKYFPKLLAFVATQEPLLQPLEAEINRYHDFRNNLYHSGIPITTTSNRVTKYSQLARQVLAVLFAIQLSPNEWAEILARVASSLGGSNVSQLVKRQVTFEESNGLIKFATAGQPTASEAVALCLYGYSVLTGDAPSKPSLIQSLAKSGHPLTKEIVAARLFDLRKSGWLQKNDLTLSAKGRKELAKKYLMV